MPLRLLRYMWKELKTPVQRRPLPLLFPESPGASEPPAPAAVPSKPPPESARHRGEAAIAYAVAMTAGSAEKRRANARVGVQACRHARAALRREFRRAYAAICQDEAELSLMAGDAGNAYAMAAEGVALADIGEQRRAELSQLMSRAAGHAQLPLPAVAAA
jgi:hypothetical protein